MESCGIAIIGAGPYGLSLAAHLHGSNPSQVRVLGEPMSFWQRNMPKGMFLRSPWSACNLSDPGRALTLDAFERELGRRIPRPVPLADFVDYGLWFQSHAVPSVDPRSVELLERSDGEFRLSLEGGETLRARVVVIAAGIVPFAAFPRQFSRISGSRVSHSSEHSDLTVFEDRRVVVIGSGQSAIESAALLKEAKASSVEVIARAPAVHWLARSAWMHRVAGRLLYAPSDIGPAGASWLVAAPWAFRRIPRTIQDPLAVRCIRPAASDWLAPRLSGVPITFTRTVAAVSESDGRLRIELDDGTHRTADHVLLATGYDVDIERYTFLDRHLVQDVDRVGGFPKLGRGFESSVRGLHFIGAPAAWSFGPLSRFVAGAGYAARGVSNRLATYEPALRRRALRRPASDSLGSGTG
jgi:cation diffusion facilitator CzcD-associated flavoprotein CzcO